jgi:hypothetical protein
MARNIRYDSLSSTAFESHDRPTGQRGGSPRGIDETPHDSYRIVPSDTLVR